MGVGPCRRRDTPYGGSLLHAVPHDLCGVRSIYLTLGGFHPFNYALGVPSSRDNGMTQQTSRPAGWKYEAVSGRQTWIIALSDKHAADRELSRVATMGSFKAGEPLSAEQIAEYGVPKGETLWLP
jgi:hypothetical protein